jgi:hypothetical protein
MNKITPKLLQEVNQQTSSTTFMLYDLTPIRESIQQAIESCDTQTDVTITSTSKKVDTHNVQITVNVQHNPRSPGGGDPSHPPKKAIVWE